MTLNDPECPALFPACAIVIAKPLCFVCPPCPPPSTHQDGWYCMKPHQAPRLSQALHVTWVMTAWWKNRRPFHTISIATVKIDPGTTIIIFELIVTLW